RPHDVSIQFRRPRNPTSREARVRSGRAVQSGQSVPHAASLCGARPRARARRRGALPRSAAVLMDAPNVLRPRDAADVAEIVRQHAGAIEPVGGGSKRAVGRVVDATALELGALEGIVDYSPAELVLT